MSLSSLTPTRRHLQSPSSQKAHLPIALGHPLRPYGTGTESANLFSKVPKSPPALSSNAPSSLWRATIRTACKTTSPFSCEPESPRPPSPPNQPQTQRVRSLNNGRLPHPIPTWGGAAGRLARFIAEMPQRSVPPRAEREPWSGRACPDLLYPSDLPPHDRLREPGGDPETENPFPRVALGPPARVRDLTCPPRPPLSSQTTGDWGFARRHAHDTGPPSAALTQVARRPPKGILGSLNKLLGVPRPHGRSELGGGKARRAERPTLQYTCGTCPDGAPRSRPPNRAAAERMRSLVCRASGLNRRVMSRSRPLPSIEPSYLFCLKDDAGRVSRGVLV